jgi:ribosomal protein L3 glutamine methyltransferase
MTPTAQPPITLPAPDPATVEQLIHYGTLLFEQSQLWFGHGTDNAFDEAAELVFFGAGLRHEDAADVYSTQVSAAGRARCSRCSSGAFASAFRPRISRTACGSPGPSSTWTSACWCRARRLPELVEAQFQPWIAPEKIHRLLDIGTGSGCIAIASALAVPQAHVDATDISDDALAVTAINIAKHGVQDRVRAIRSDVFAALRGERYDIIVSNPPYVGDEEMAGLPQEYRHEPATGLHSGVDGLDVVRRILSGAAAHLEPHGLLIVEVGNSETALAAAFPDVPFTWLEFERGGGGVFLLSAEQLESVHVR